MSHSPDNSSASSLFCGEDAGDVVSCHADTSISDRHPSSLLSLPYHHPSDEAAIERLFDSESDFMPHPDYIRRFRDRSIDVIARQDSINWILKVHSYYRFKPVTALLAVNYFDRFLSSNSLPQPSGWPFQLLSVACLSLAAKMEEPMVPLLLDLQVFDPKFVFEPKTVQRMELWVMANLHWRLRSVTAFDFLDYYISKLPSSSSFSTHGLFSASSDLILRTTRVIDFLGYASSAIAAAAVLCAAADGLDSSSGGMVTTSFHERLDKEMARSCHQLMEEYLVDTCPTSLLKERRAEPTPPPSPVGVLDAAACGSCETRSNNPDSSSQAETPPAKRLRSAPG